MSDLIDRINEHCVGHPHAKIPWPHRLLHDCRDEITRLRAELDTLKKLYENAVETRVYYAEARNKERDRADAAEDAIEAAIAAVTLARAL